MLYNFNLIIGRKEVTMKKVSVLLFIFLALAADLKVTIFPYIHWLAWLVLIFPFMIWDFARKGFVLSPLFGMSIVIFVGSCLISVMNKLKKLIDT